MNTIKRIFTKKRIIWAVSIILVVFVVWFGFFRKTTANGIQTGVVKKQDIQKTVLATGQVVSSTDLDLSFQTGGIVKDIRVKEGDVVYAGETLAVLDQGSTLASSESAQGTLAQAEASVGSAQTALENAQQNLLNQLNVAYGSAKNVILSNTNNLFSNPESSSPQFGIVGTVQTNSQLVSSVNNERVSVNGALSDWQKEISTLSLSNVDDVTSSSLSHLSVVTNYLTDVLDLLTTSTQVTSGGSQATVNTNISSVSGAKSTIDALTTAIKTYNQAIKTANSSLESAKAQIISAQGQVHSADVSVNNTILRAPAYGTITQVDIRLGEQAQAMKEAIKLQNVNDLHTEASVSEADIASITVGQEIDNTFDALGPDKHFKSKVMTVNPSSNTISGVVYYKVTGGLENIKGVKPGMTANMTILVAEKKEVLTIASSAIINRDNKKYVKVVDDLKNNLYHEVEVTTGLEADGGLVEVLTGLTEGQEVITYMK